MTTNTFRFLYQRFRCDERGIIAVEMALLLPFLLVMFVGLIEVSRYILVNQKAEKVANSVADIVAQATTISTGDLNLLLSATPNMMSPYGFSSNGLVIITSVTRTGTAAPKVRWQHQGGGTLSKTSLVGAVNADAALPGGLTLNDKDNIIIAEVFYRFTPLLGTFLLTNTDLYKVAVFKPRLGALNALN